MFVERGIVLIFGCRQIVRDGLGCFVVLKFLGLSCLRAVFSPYMKPVLVHSIQPSLKMNVKKANVFYFRSTLPFGMAIF